MDDVSDAAKGLMAFLEEVGDAPEVLWAAGLAMVNRAVDEARDARFGRFRHHPRGELRRLRRDLAAGMKLARLAVALQEAETDRDHELYHELHERAVAEGIARRRLQTLPAELARLEKRRRTKAGLPAENFHLRADYLNGSGARAEDGDGAGDGDE